MKLVLTGGHHSSALPLIAELRNRLPQIELYWFGHKHSLLKDKNPTLEYLEITKLRIPFYELHAGKVYRTFDVGRLAKVPYGLLQALWLLKKIKPNAIMSFGGYLAVPTVIAGWLLGIPCYTHEQTLVAGYANKVIARFVRKIFVSWPESIAHFPTGKVVYSGIPLRKCIFSSQSNNFPVNPVLPTVYVTGGKTGSHSINRVVHDSMEQLLTRYNLIVQCGNYSEFTDFKDLVTKADSLQGKVAGEAHVRQFVFEDEIGEVYAKADVVVARSGAHTVAEMLALSKRCVLIPIPWVSHNEQQVNAEYLVKKGLGIILPESDFSSERLLAALSQALGLSRVLQPNGSAASPEKLLADVLLQQDGVPRV